MGPDEQPCWYLKIWPCQHSGKSIIQDVGIIVQVQGDAGTATQCLPLPWQLRTELLCFRVAGRPVGGRKFYRPERLIQNDERKPHLPCGTPCFMIRNHAFHRLFGL